MGLWKSYTTLDGLASNCVVSLFVTPDDTLWCGTDNHAPYRPLCRVSCSQHHRQPVQREGHPFGYGRNVRAQCRLGAECLLPPAGCLSQTQDFGEA